MDTNQGILSAEAQSSKSCHFNMEPGGVAVLLAKGLDINHLYVLEYLHIHKVLPNLNRVGDWIQTLFRKGYVTADNVVTLKGDQLLMEVGMGKEIEPIPYDQDSDWFLKWWLEAYPSTDAFNYKGVFFPGSQSKRDDKKESRKAFESAANEMRISQEDIYWATKAQISMAKEKSIQTGRSEITHIPNSLRYLQKRSFEPFIEAGRNLKTKPNKSTTDTFNHVI